MNSLRIRLEIFAKFSQDDRDLLQQLASRNIRDIRPRRDLVREGERPRFVYVMLDGWACRYKMLPDGRRQIVAFVMPGDLFDNHVFMLRELDHSIASITALRVAEIGREELEALVTDRPGVAQALWLNDLASLAVQREWTLNVGQRSAYERLAHLLCELFARLGSIGMTDGNACDFPLTQVDLADATGLTPVHVNRMLQELRGAGLIELQSRKLTVLDPAALQTAALFNDRYLHLNREPGI